MTLTTPEASTADIETQKGACLLEILCVLIILGTMYSAGALAANRVLLPYARAVEIASVTQALEYYRELAILTGRDIQLSFLPQSQELRIRNSPAETILKFSPRVPLIAARFGLQSGTSGTLIFRADYSCSAGRITIGTTPSCSIVLSRYGRIRSRCG